MVLKGGHRDALPPRKGRHGRKRSREREAHSLQGVSREGVKGWKRVPCFNNIEGQLQL